MDTSPLLPPGAPPGRCIVVLGPQGAGKGVQSSRLAASLGWVHIALGDVLRAAVAQRTPLGRQVAPLLAAGALVPDELAVAVVAGALREHGAEEGVVLDGFPRTLAQARDLAEVLPAGEVDLALHLWVPRSVALARLAGRGRADDTPAAVERRLRAHDHHHRAVLRWYELLGRLVEADGVGTPDEVAERVSALVGARLGGRVRAGAQ